MANKKYGVPVEISDTIAGLVRQRHRRQLYLIFYGSTLGLPLKIQCLLLQTVQLIH